MSHNIFKQPPELRALYEKYHLVELLEENFKTIDFESNPLLYILAIADTLEPIKAYQQNAALSAQVIAEAIDIEYTPRTRQLRFSSSSEKVNIAILHRKAMGLMEWTSAKCSVLENGAFTLMI